MTEEGGLPDLSTTKYSLNIPINIVNENWMSDYV